MTLEQLFDNHAELGDRLFDLRHRQWRAELPADYKPLLTTSTVAPLRLTPTEAKELNLEILNTRLSILKLAQRIHISRFGKVPGWVEQGLIDLKTELQRAIW